MENRDPNSDYADFIAKLNAYHKARGTNFDPEPRVGAKHINLLDLFNLVMRHGGYDKVSDEKLAWRKLGQEFSLGNNNLPALAFSLKTAYYKNLAAYEISTVHHREPPPREILEDVTAKGGALLTRTLTNYRPSTRRETGGLGVTEQSGESGEDGTPVRDRNESEDTPGSGGRATRGLRQAPPQRILFQPDSLPARQSRHAPQTASTPAAALSMPRGASTSHNPSSNPENMSHTVANYEPRPQIPLTLRPITTPSNDATGFARRQRTQREQAEANLGNSVQNARMMLPGTGFDGPNIYVRCLLALKSGIPAEQDYALHHLVKISMERGDKYRFESFPGLAEALINKVLEISSLFYEIAWEVLYLEDGRKRGPGTLDGVDGTPDILQRIDGLVKKDVDDNIQPKEFSDLLLQVNEAALTIRNMVMLEENAQYVSTMHPLRDLLSIVLNLPKLECVVELKHYMLDIAEQLTKYLCLQPTDPLYLSLLAQLRSEDRGAILTSLRSISRISLNLEENNRLEGIPGDTIQSILDWTLLEDEELAHTSLDFLYQYTAVGANVNILLTETHVDALVNQLTRLLSHGQKVMHYEVPLTANHPRTPAPTEVPILPQEVLHQLLQMEEPERSSKWLRCLFDEDKDESITQIALWQAYQARFSAAVQENNRPLLPAADFIKNVSTTFADKANAQVQSGPTQKFIIKGIRIRDTPVDLRGKKFTKCKWQLRSDIHGLPARECSEYFMEAEQLYNHILGEHASVPKGDEGKFLNVVSDHYCAWSGCTKYRTPVPLKTYQYGSHLKIHVLAAIDSTGRGPKPRDESTIRKDKYYITPTDERGDAAGIPLTAVLVLRNLARNIPKTDADEIATKEEGGVSFVSRLFNPVMPSLWEIFAHNKSLAPYLTDLIQSISEAAGL